MNENIGANTEITCEENSILGAIYERYIDLADLNGQHTYSLQYKGSLLTRTGLSQRKIQNDNNCSVVSQNDIHISISTSPRKSGNKENL